VCVILQVGRLGVRVGTDAAVAAARERFLAERCVLLPGFVAPDLLRAVQQQLTDAPFAPFVHAAVGAHVTELVLEEPRLTGRLQFLFNDARIFDTVSRVTGRTGIGCFAARVYRMIPGRGHHDDWHDDLADDGSPIQQLAAMSINLSDGVYEGGTLQIRDRGDQRLVHEVANTGTGDAILFALSEQLQHRVTDVTGTAAKTAFAGWFRTAPVYRDMVRAAAGTPQAV
jgi:hypothetical protein